MAATSKGKHSHTQAIIAHLLNIGWRWDETIKGRLLAPADGRWIEYDARSGRLRFSRSCSAALRHLIHQHLPPRRRRGTRTRRIRPLELGRARDISHCITLRVAWRHQDLVQIEARVVADDWCEAVAAYTTPEEIRRFAGGLARFAGGLAEEAGYRAGREDGIGELAMTFRLADDPRHVACRLGLAVNKATIYSPAARTDRLSLDLRTERARLGDFIDRLEHIAAARVSEAILAVE